MQDHQWLIFNYMYFYSSVICKEYFCSFLNFYDTTLRRCFGILNATGISWRPHENITDTWLYILLIIFTGLVIAAVDRDLELLTLLLHLQLLASARDALGRSPG
jgi:hypothetical protein